MQLFPSNPNAPTTAQDWAGILTRRQNRLKTLEACNAPTIMIENEQGLIAEAQARLGKLVS